MQFDFWKNKRVLVGGGCGFLGSYLVPELVEAGARVTVADNFENSTSDSIASVAKDIELIEGDLRDDAFCDRVTKNQDVVINLAAKAFGVGFSQAHHGEMLVYNLQCTLTPLEAARRNGVERLMIVSSACVYPDDAPLPTPELDVFTGMPETANSGYGWAKRIQELAGIYYSSERDMKISVVRPFNPYGANYRWGSEEKAHVIPSLVKRVLDGENPLVVWGNGEQRRSFLHARDAARMILKVGEIVEDATPVNVGFDDDVSIKELVNTILEVTGKSPEVIYDTSKPAGSLRKCADPTRFNELTGGYRPSATLREGIAEMVEWYERNFTEPAELQVTT